MNCGIDIRGGAPGTRDIAVDINRVGILAVEVVTKAIINSVKLCGR